MIEVLQKILKKIGEFQINHFYLAIILVLLFTGFCIAGATKIKFESDLDKMNPQDLDVVKLNNRITDKFGNSEAIIILIELDEESNLDNPITDIRDPRVLEFVNNLQNNLLKDKRINEVQSAALFFGEEIPKTLDESKEILGQIPQSSQVFNEAYSFTIVNIIADVGFDEAKIMELNTEVQKIIEDSSKPGGIKTSITGNPPLMAVMFNFLVHDSFMTLIYASIFIFVLIFILTRSFSSSTIIIMPLLFGLIWTIGTLGWTETPITLATAGLSAMLLGLGVEYAIFLFSRFEEENKNTSTNEAIVKALSTTGASTVSSGLTTIIGFAVLTLSIFPMLSSLGFSLAIGIAYILLSTMIVLPLSVLIQQKILKNKNKKQKKELSDYLENMFEIYGKFVSNKPIFVIIFGIIITIAMFSGLNQINNQGIDFDTVLPDGLEELNAFNTIFNDKGETTSVNIYIEVIPSENSIQDIRDPRVINYINILTQKVQYISYFESVNSISSFEKEINNNEIPQTLREQKELLEDVDVSSYLTEDYSGTMIRTKINLASGGDGSSEDAEIARQINEIIDSTETPVGLFVTGSGDLFINNEIKKVQDPDTTKTSIYALIGIILLLLILSRSIKYTILPLVTVILGIIWTLGLIGFFQVPFSSITSSVITMTIGIGIDFGLQLSMRFRQELENNDKIQSMTNTLKYTLYPMVITVIAAIIGFGTMRLGKLNLMGDLGTAMSFGIVGCMLVAISIVAGLIVVFERRKV